MAFANENILSGHGPELASIRTPQGGQPVRTVTLVDLQTPDTPVDAVALLELQDDATYADWDATGGSFVAVARCAWTDVETVFSVEGSDVDATQGQFKFQVPLTGTETPGIFLLEYEIKNSEGVLVFTNQAYMDVQPSIANRQTGNFFSIPMLRMALRDAHPRANRVLEECEFSMAEILNAIDMVVQEFDSLPPVFGTLVFTVTSFPHPIRLLKGVVGELLMMAGLWYERNNLHLSGSGLTVNDLSKGEFYLKIGKMYKDEFERWARMYKRQLNVSRGWGTVNSLMYHRRWY